jgi:hypothetical protein
VATIAEKVETVFRHLASGNFSKSTDLEESGWEMQLPSGGFVVRSMLQAEASPLIAAGPKVVPHLIPWVLNDNLALRYVAVYALEQITGEKSDVAYFDKTLPAKAIEIWRSWYERTAGQEES